MNTNRMDIKFLINPDAVPSSEGEDFLLASAPIQNTLSHVALEVINQSNHSLNPSHDAQSNFYVSQITPFHLPPPRRIERMEEEVGAVLGSMTENFSLEQIDNHQENSEEKPRGKWSTDEEENLAILIDQNGGNPSSFTSETWKKIADQMKTRTSRQIRYHWNRCSNPEIKTSRWTKKEDTILQSQVDKYGRKNQLGKNEPQWTKIVKVLPGRTAIQARQRYIRIVNPDIRKSAWTTQEDELLKAGVKKFGNSWKHIADSINKTLNLKTVRTNYQCSARWLTLARLGIT